MTMLGSAGVSTPPKASNGRFGTPGKDDILLADVKFEGVLITKGCSEVDPPAS